MHTGSCLCGAVEFEVTEELKAPDACHCDACRKSTGHYLVSTDVKEDALKISGEENISWFQSSEKVRRGFCLMCGSTLFFDAIFKDWIGVSMGAFDKPTDTKLAMHIFTAEKGDYYEITDDLPQNEH
ncbi:GFA family protein [Maritalea porphyrae]|uniref:GFA family protein n=1 Tax=Maritalea porphyrae TaxID=880732 RepID=UPI0022AF35CA|nr:GFA family protein [Maritalea porphyrae]MCZ4272544.1 GFA family protein [Maritalea porphyrae]